METDIPPSTLLPEPDIARSLGRHDMFWDRFPTTWDNSIFLGNGMMGCCLRSVVHRSKRHSLRFVMGREDVTARRERGYAVRVPIGDFEMDFGSWIDEGASASLSLWDAEFRAALVTVHGKGTLRGFIHSEQDVLALELKCSGETAVYYCVPFPKLSPASRMDDGRPDLDQYLPETKCSNCKKEGVHISRQRYTQTGEGCLMAWLEAPGPEGARVFYSTVQRGWDDTAVERAVALLQEAAAAGYENYAASHRAWWRRYFSRSLISIPDTELEGFYHIQMYKIASATRPRCPVLDNQGPWTAPTPWPGTWYNMNVQLAYSPVYTSNHLELGRSLCEGLAANLPNLAGNVPPEYREDCSALGRTASHDMVCPVDDEIGNLVWVCHNVYRQYRCSMDQGLLEGLLYPLLKRSVNFYLRLLQEGEDGLFHLPATISPEYGARRNQKVPDCSYDLYLLRWGLVTLGELEGRLGRGPEEQASREAVLNRLPPYPADETGLLVGRGVRVDEGHRHYSHLLGIWPLFLLDCGEEKTRQLAERSLHRWLSWEGDLRGFTWAGAAAIAAVLGQGGQALNFLKSGLRYCSSNTFYREGGPVVESPLGMAEAL